VQFVYIDEVYETLMYNKANSYCRRLRTRRRIVFTVYATKMNGVTVCQYSGDERCWARPRCQRTL